jgi:hypothetical protein
MLEALMPINISLKNSFISLTKTLKNNMLIDIKLSEDRFFLKILLKLVGECFSKHLNNITFGILFIRFNVI